MKKPSKMFLDQATEIVIKHGRYLNENCYGVRWPEYSGSGLVLATDTHELVEKLARRLEKEAE